MPDDIPLDDIPADDEAPEEPANEPDSEADVSPTTDDDAEPDDGSAAGSGLPPDVAERLGANAAAVVAYARRASGVLAAGLESVVAQKPEIKNTAVSMVELEQLEAEYADLDHVSLELRLAVSEEESYPLAVLISLEDVGALFMVAISPDQMEEEASRAAQLEMISAGLKELLDLSGLMLFTDGLAGAEITLAEIRWRSISETLAWLASTDADLSALRVDFGLQLPDGPEARVAFLLPAGITPRLGELAASSPTPLEPGEEPRTDARPRLVDVNELESEIADTAAAAVEPTAIPDEPPVAPAAGDGAGRGSDTPPAPPLPPPAGAPEPQPESHPVRFPSIMPPVSPVASAQGIELILDVDLRVTVELGRASMTIENVLNLGPGSVVELNKLAGEPVDLLVNDRLIARGEVVVVDENFGVRVTEILSPRSRVQALGR